MIASLHRALGGFKLFLRSHQGELNSRPAAYKAAALPTELWWRIESIVPFGKRVSAWLSRAPTRKSLIFGNHGKAFIRRTRPPMRCVISLPCPTCGNELAFLEQYQRHYCYACGNYAPEGYGDRGAKICPTCRGILSYVAQYDRHYCYRCNAYPADDAVLQSLEATMPVDIRPAPEASEPSIPVTEPEKTEVAEKPGEVERTVDPEKISEPSVEPLVTVAGAPATPIPQPEEIVEEEPPQSEATEARPRPPIVRLKVFQAKKPALMDLCKAYNLDPTGTKEQLRERLLSYLDTLEAEAEVEQSVEEPESSAEPATTEPAGEVERESWPTSREIVEAQPVEEEPARGAASPPAVTPAGIETRPLQESVVERIDTPVLVAVPESQPD